MVGHNRLKMGYGANPAVASRGRGLVDEEPPPRPAAAGAQLPTLLQRSTRGKVRHMLVVLLRGGVSWEGVGGGVCSYPKAPARLG